MPYSYHSLSLCLEVSGIPTHDAREEALLLLEAFGGADRVSLLCDRHRIYDTSALDKAVERRLSRYPLQYILGKWDFYGSTFRVNEHCLIPRPDTELLVELAITHLPQDGVFVDLCTGSGCIAVSVLKHRPDLKAVALELFPDTLALAVENAKLNGVADRLIPVCADLLNEGKEALVPYAPFCGILSNPPYIPTAVVAGLEPELFFEPHAALDGGEDGLIFYKKILSDYWPLMSPGAPLLLEIGFDQAKTLSALGKALMPSVTPKIYQDLGGNPRVVAFGTPFDIPTYHNVDSV